MTYQHDAGTTLAAADALKERRGGTWTDDQVAYLIAVAYRLGAQHATNAEMAEIIATWEEQPTTPAETRRRLIAGRLAAMEARSGPATYMGGPVDWETGRPLTEVAT